MYSQKKRKRSMGTANTKKMKSAHTASPLPEEITEDILSRLPAKSVRRFRSVSRSWAAMLSSPTFRDLHLERARAGHAQLSFKPNELAAPFYACRPDGGPVEKMMGTTDHFPLGSKVFPITKSCHGLRCTGGQPPRSPRCATFGVMGGKELYSATAICTSPEKTVLSPVSMSEMRHMSMPPPELYSPIMQTRRTRTLTTLTISGC